MTADMIANNNELYAHTNPLHLTFPKHLSPVDLEVYEAAVERAEAFFLAQERDPKKTSAHPIPTAELLTPLNPSSPYIATVLILNKGPSSTIPRHNTPNLSQSVPSPRDVSNITANS
jgi:hypothetical protein